MIELMISSLFGLVAIVSALALVDCWMRGRWVFARLESERALFDAGFVPVAEPLEMRQREARREPLGYNTLAAFNRPSQQRPVARCHPQPLSQAAPAGA